ncbi:MAG: UvrD-helicase domain-containing protein, partial [Flavobacteriales bacterium]|nr:UvrD-helicase domain-containing protein [Flavobacteriales bacterium]
HMLHHWSEVAISTIDAFTRKVVRPFARDLQLDHDLRMTTEQDHYLDLAVQALIAEAGVDPAITTLLSEACLQLLHEERKWDPEKPLKELSAELTKESAIVPLRLLGELTPEQVTALADRLRSEEITFRRAVNGLGEKAMRLFADHRITAADVANAKGGIHGYFRKLAEFNEVWDPPGPNTLKPMESGKWYSGKAGPETIAALEALSGPLTALFHEAEALRAQGYRAYTIRRAVARELLPAFALHALDVKLEAIKREEGVTFFSDLTRKVSEVVRHEPVPFIYERMGERYRHFLIDEFQDTSLLQWQALLPLIENALSTGGSALLVGDAKQAIYRWRNGEVRLFTELPAIFGNGDGPVEQDREATLRRNYAAGERLAYNRRSAAAVVAFNNTLFTPLHTVLAEDLRKVYAEHAQETARSEQGLVHVEVLPKEVTGEERQKALLDFTLKRVREALADGFAPGDIAVLVRGRSVGGPVSAHLVQHGYAVISPDGLRLAGDPVIEAIIDLLRFLHADDVAAAARAIQYMGMLNAPPGAQQVDPFSTVIDPAATIRKWIRTHAIALRTTLSALLADIARAMDLAPAEDAPILALLDEAHAWTTQHGQDIGGFLSHWERKGGERSVDAPDHGQAIQVLTVHRSKGLQFPVVIVPNANMTTRGNFAERFWVDPGDAVPELPVALVRESQALRAAELPELMEETSLRTLDASNLLYVAFTRPEQRLYALVPEYGADAITKAVLDHVKEHGTDGTLIRGERAAPWSVRPRAQQLELQDVAGSSSTASLVMRMEAPADWDPADPDPYRSFGNAVHDVLARIVSAADLPAAIDAGLADGSITVDVAERLRTDLTALLASPDVAPWFSKDLEVRNEATLLTAEGQALRPDRVVIDGDRVRVLDIKTGNPMTEHHQQVRNYMRQLEALGHAHVEGALLYVQKGELESVA